MRRTIWLIPLMILILFLGCTACDESDDSDDDQQDDDTQDDDDQQDDDDLDDDDTEDDDDDDDELPPPFADMELDVMTYNILFAFPNADYDPWTVRDDHVAEIINFHDPDLLGIQEPLFWQVDDLHELCPGYIHHNIGLHSDSTLYFKKERFTLLDKGDFWLSPTPEKPSIGYGNFFPRNVVWVELYDNQSGWRFFFFNTHFDNTRPFQENAAPMFLDYLEAISWSAPLVTTGDFNSKPDREAYHILTEGNSPGGFHLVNSFDLAGDFDIRLAPGDQREYDPGHRIDHIFVSNAQWQSDYWVVDMTRYGDPLRDPSDHLAMAAHIILPLE